MYAPIFCSIWPSTRIPAGSHDLWSGGQSSIHATDWLGRQNKLGTHHCFLALFTVQIPLFGLWTEGLDRWTAITKLDRWDWHTPGLGLTMHWNQWLLGSAKHYYLCVFSTVRITIAGQLRIWSTPTVLLSISSQVLKEVKRNRFPPKKVGSAHVLLVQREHSFRRGCACNFLKNKERHIHLRQRFGG